VSYSVDRAKEPKDRMESLNREESRGGGSSWGGGVKGVQRGHTNTETVFVKYITGELSQLQLILHVHTISGMPS